MSRGWSLAGALLGIVLGLVFFAPAAWVAGALANASAGQLQLREPRGTAWHGQAQLVLTGGEGSRDALALPGRLEWWLHPGLGSVRLELRALCCTPDVLELRLEPGWGRGRVVVADGRSEWPAALLAGLGAPWNSIQPQGLLQLATQGLSVEWSAGRISMSGSARLDALGMSSSLSTLRPVGSYRLTVAGFAQGAPNLQLSTLEGSLELRGAGQWTGSRFRFRGEAGTVPEQEPTLANLLNIIGRRQGAKSVISLG